MVRLEGVVSPSQSLPGPSSSSAGTPTATAPVYNPPTPATRSKGKEPARGRSRLQEWETVVIEEPPRVYPYNVDRFQPPVYQTSSTPPPSTATGPPSSTRGDRRQSAPPLETVGSVLEEIANSLNGIIGSFQIADQRHWGADEQDQLRRLEETIDEAAKDFQELSHLVNGQFYYENDKNAFSTAELSQLSELFEALRDTFQEWLRGGGPINPLWARETTRLRKSLHRAQCRAAGRIFASAREESHRCLGAHLVQRARSEATRLRGYRQSLASIPERSSLSSRTSLAGNIGIPGSIEEQDQVAACNSTGNFERFGEQDIAYVCDFCDGYIVWEDLSAMPSTRLKRSLEDQAREHRRSRDRESLMWTRRNPRGIRELILPRYHAEQQLISMDAGSRSSATISSDPGTRSSILSESPTVTSATSTLLGTDGTSNHEYSWMASGISFSSVEDDSKSSPVEKTIIFAPVAIANHVPPGGGEWQARLLCPYCDDWVIYAQGDNEMEAVKYAQDENGFESHERLLEHLSWYHAPGYLETIASPVKSATGRSSCVVM